MRIIGQVDLALVRALHNATIYLLAVKAQVDPVKILQMPIDRRDQKREEWRVAMRMRRRAVYVTLTLFNLQQNEVAASLGISREAVRQMLERAQQEADDDLDYALDELAFLNHGPSDEQSLRRSRI